MSGGNTVISYALVEALEVLAEAGHGVTVSSNSVGGKYPTIHHQAAGKLVRGGMATCDAHGCFAITDDGAVVLRVAKCLMRP